MKIRENFGDNLKNELTTQYSNLGNLSSSNFEGRKSLNSLIGSIEEDECEDCKEENKESMGASSAGGYSAPLFSMTKKEMDEIVKMETKEATSTSSNATYDAPGFEDVNMRGNHPKGSGKTHKKTLLPGGKFVEVKDKCKKSPYCNQGDINALNIHNESDLTKIIKNLSDKFQLTESEVRSIISYELKKMK
jgi:hypothetical protein